MLSSALAALVTLLQYARYMRFEVPALILATASADKAVAEILRGLRERGRVIVLSATTEPIEVSASDHSVRQPVDRGRTFGRPGGRRGDAEVQRADRHRRDDRERTLERAAEAYARMMAGKARFRMLLTMGR